MQKFTSAFRPRPISTQELFSFAHASEEEKSSGEPWNKRLFHWFSRRTKNTQKSFGLALFSASAAYYKLEYTRKEKLFAVGNFGN